MTLGLVELGLLALAGPPFGLGAALVWRKRPAERAPLPLGALAACGAGVLLAGLGGVLLGPSLYRAMVVPGLVFAFGGAEVAAQRACALTTALALALPFLAAAGSLALSARRSIREAVVLGVAVGVGYAAGAGLFWLASGGARGFFEGLGELDVASWAIATAKMLAACGLAGATLTGVAAVAGRSREALGTVAVASLGMPGLALGVAAWMTPPDPVSQLLVALPIAVCWGLGLGLGAAITAARPG